jgi:hypothetical protein
MGAQFQSIFQELKTLNQILAHKEQEANRDFGERRTQIDQLRTDIATLFGGALQSFAGVEEKLAIAFTQKYMYPATNGRA